MRPQLRPARPAQGPTTTTTKGLVTASAPGRDRTCDPLLRRQYSGMARRRCLTPDIASSCDNAAGKCLISLWTGHRWLPVWLPVGSAASVLAASAAWSW